MTSGSEGCRVPSPRSITIRWTVATAVGHVAGVGVWALPAWWLWSGPGDGSGPASSMAMVGLTLAAAACQGLILGLAQGRVLRAISNVRGHWWAFATSAGVTLGWLFFMIVGEIFGRISIGAIEFIFLALLAGTLFGAVVGGTQWAVARKSMRWSGRWVATSGVGWGCALVISVVAIRWLPGSDTSILVGGTVAAILSGAVIGLVTGRGLADLTHKP